MSLPSRSLEIKCTKLLSAVLLRCAARVACLFTLTVEESFHSFSMYSGINQAGATCCCKYPIKLSYAHLHNIFFLIFIFLKSCLSTILKGTLPWITKEVLFKIARTCLSTQQATCSIVPTSASCSLPSPPSEKKKKCSTDPLTACFHWGEREDKGKKVSSPVQEN